MRIAIVLAFAFILAQAQAAAALSPFAGAGYDYYTGSGGQITRSAMVVGGASLASVAGALTFTRYDDNLAGRGYGGTAMVNLPVGPTGAFRAWGSRLVGDGALRAWRFKVGPRFAVPAGPSFGLYYQRYTDNARTDSWGGTAEAEWPLSGLITGRASAGMARVPGGSTSQQGLLGVSWRPVQRLELSGDAGFARNGTFTSGPGPARLPAVPLLGLGSGGSGASSSAPTERVAEIGMRVTFP